MLRHGCLQNLLAKPASNTGDANGHEAVNGDDFLIEQAQIGRGVGEATVTVPEPASIALLLSSAAVTVLLPRIISR